MFAALGTKLHGGLDGRRVGLHPAEQLGDELVELIELVLHRRDPLFPRRVVGLVAEELQTEAERIALLIELARNEALQRNETWGVIVAPELYGFTVFDHELKIWRPIETGTFRERTLEPGYELVVAVESPVALDPENRDELAPNVAIFANGEVTPFDIEVIPPWETVPWIVRSDGIQRTRARRANDLEPLTASR